MKCEECKVYIDERGYTHSYYCTQQPIKEQLSKCLKVIEQQKVSNQRYAYNNIVAHTRLKERVSVLENKVKQLKHENNKLRKATYKQEQIKRYNSKE
jgi:hypothetical protein